MRSLRLELFLLLALLPAPAAAAGPLREYVRVTDRPWLRIGVTVTVTDRHGRPVTGLGRDDLLVTENGQPVDLADFGPEEGRRDRPLSVAVLLDLSESMGTQIRKVEEAARALLAALRPGDEIMIAKFNDQLTVLQPFTGRIPDEGGPLRRIGRAWGGTALFRAVEGTLKDLRSRPGRKIVLVVSDGQDNDLERSEPVLQSLYLQDLLRLCVRTGTTVYGVRPGMPSSWLPFEDFVRQTGGRLLYSGGDLERLFARLGEEFLSQYYLAWDIDPKVGEGAWRRVRVRARRDDLQVSALQGYFTPRGHLETLLRDVADRDAGVRGDAVYDLGFVDDPRARAALRLALSDRDAAVRRLACEALGRLLDADSVSPLIERLRDADAETARAAGAAIESIGPAAIEPLAAAVQEADGRRRPPAGTAAAARLLGRIGDDRAVGPLAGLLQSDLPEIRLAAVEALEDLGFAGGLAALRRALDDPEAGIRRAALEAIDRVGGSAARPVLVGHLARESDPAVRAALERILDRP